MDIRKCDCCYHQPEHRDDFVRESLRQNEFWLRIMQEHALFIRLGLTCQLGGSNFPLLIDHIRRELFVLGLFS